MDDREIFENFTSSWAYKEKMRAQRIVAQQRRDLHVLQKEITRWEYFIEENGGKDHIVEAVAHLEACEFAKNNYPE